MINGKKAQGMSTNTIILIVLGVLVLVILAVGFIMGWDKIAPWLSKANVDEVAQQCGIACSTGKVYDFNVKVMELTDEDKVEVKTSCLVLANEFTKYAIETCPSITDKPECKDVKINAKSAAAAGVTACTAAQYDVSALVSDADGTTNFCCIDGKA